MVIVVFMPYERVGCSVKFVNTFSDDGFELSHNCSQYVRDRLPESGLCTGLPLANPLRCQNNNTVNMIRHNHELVQNHIFSDRFCMFPFLKSNAAYRIEQHFSINGYITEYSLIT